MMQRMSSVSHLDQQIWIDPVVVQYDMACGRKKNYVYIVPKCKAGFAICVPVACAIFFFLFFFVEESIMRCDAVTH